MSRFVLQEILYIFFIFVIGFGRDDAKTLFEFAQEIARGQCYLQPTEDGTS